VSGRLEWVLLAYRLPREPSGPRVTLWRKLRRLGVVQVLDGLVALPADARTREQLEWLADEVLEAGGEASVWLGRLGSAAQERALAGRMAMAVAADYAAVAADAATGEGESGVVRRRTVARLRRELQRIGRRDFFPPAERERAHRAVDDLAARFVVR
jgi:Protein ChrB, N-terminal